MKQLVERFSAQLKEASAIGRRAKLTQAKKPFANVMVCGMGGSGIGGTIVAEIAAVESRIPILVNKNYTLPGFIGPESLVIISSYSGNTEESIHAFERALERRAKVVCISSGGKAIEMAKAKKIDHIIIPAGMPARSCLGYLLIPILFTLNFHKILKPHFKSHLEAAIELLDKEEENIRQEAWRVAKKIFNKVPIIYSSAESVALRFRQQLNENSKVLAWHNILPEMNHNELAGWRDKNKSLAAIFFRDQADHHRISKRMEMTMNLIRRKCGGVIEIHSKGVSMIEKILYQIHIGDWISVFLAEMKKVNSIETKIQEDLKAALAKIPN